MLIWSVLGSVLVIVIAALHMGGAARSYDVRIQDYVSLDDAMWPSGLGATFIALTSDLTYFTDSRKYFLLALIWLTIILSSYIAMVRIKFS